MLAVGVMRAAAWPNLLAMPLAACDISAPSGKSVRLASCCVAAGEGWQRGSVAAKRHVSLLQ